MSSHIDKRLLPEKINDLNGTFLELQTENLINEDDIAKFNKNLNHYKKFHNIPIKYNLSESDAASFLVKNQLPGVEVEPYFHRFTLMEFLALTL